MTRARSLLALALAVAVAAPGRPGPPAPTERVIIRLVDPTPRAALLLEVTAGDYNLAERHERAVEGLQAIHQRALGAAGPILAEAEAAGALVVLDRLWSVNAVVARIDPAWIPRLEASPAIASIVADGRLTLGRETGAGASAGTADPTMDLVRIHVPEVWAEGITGQGAVVANTDTGVNGGDGTMGDRWRGRYRGADATWYAPTALTVFPQDDDNSSRGHGTATMGILTGGEATFGVAYGATWMAGDVFEGGEGFVSHSLKILEWLADPDGDPTTSADVPDVVSNSYGLIDPLTGRPVCDPIFNDAIDALEAAGAIVVWSAGNEGTDGVTAPANRAASPVNAFAVGAVDGSSSPLASSGRGPSACGGANATKPEVVAPGQSVTSRTRFNQTSTFTGTSFATPMVGGVLALMRSKNPTITPEAAKTILLDTATDLTAPGDDNDTGHGLVNAQAALARVVRPTQPLARLVGYRPAGVGAKLGLVPAQAEETLVLAPGQTLDLVPVLTNHGPAIPGSTGTLTSPTPGVQVVRGTVTLEGAATGAVFGPVGGESFGITIGASVPPGSDIVLSMAVQGAAIGPFKIVLKAGEPVAGNFATHDRGEVRLSVTNFGGLGYYTGIHSVGFALRGEGFRFPPSSPNWLFHAGLLAGTGPTRLSDDVPYGEDTQNATDWVPLFGAPIVMDEALGGQRITAAYDDRRAPSPLDLQVRQESFAWSDAEAEDFIVIQYIVTNTGAQTMGGLRFGLFVDWDLPGPGGTPAERTGWDAANRLAFVEGSGGQPTLGAVWLDDVSVAQLSYAALTRDSIAASPKGSPASLVPAEATTGGQEFTDAEKWDALSGGQTRTSDTRAADQWQVLGVGPVTLGAGATDTVAVALVGGADRQDLATNAAAAREAYFVRVLGQEPPPPPPPPEELALSQNFPNPFSHGHSTTIRYTVPPDATGALPRVDLAVYDVAGRRVRQLFAGTPSSGDLAAVWDGTDDAGRAAPAGVYVLRLVAGGRDVTKRMLLLP